MIVEPSTNARMIESGPSVSIACSNAGWLVNVSAAEELSRSKRSMFACLSDTTSQPLNESWSTGLEGSCAVAFFANASNFFASRGCVSATKWSPSPLKSSQTRSTSSPSAGFRSRSQSMPLSFLKLSLRSCSPFALSGKWLASASTFFHWSESGFVSSATYAGAVAGTRSLAPVPAPSVPPQPAASSASGTIAVIQAILIAPCIGRRTRYLDPGNGRRQRGWSQAPRRTRPPPVVAQATTVPRWVRFSPSAGSG